MFSLLPRPKNVFPSARSGPCVSTRPAENGFVLHGEIGVHDANQIDVRKITGGDGKVAAPPSMRSTLPRSFHGTQQPIQQR
jgi:hypothetical protein